MSDQSPRPLSPKISDKFVPPLSILLFFHVPVLPTDKMALEDGTVRARSNDPCVATHSLSGLAPGPVSQRFSVVYLGCLVCPLLISLSLTHTNLFLNTCSGILVMTGLLCFVRSSLALLTAAFLLHPRVAVSHEYRDDLAAWNLNDNQTAGTNVLGYSTSRSSGNYTPSPDNWRQLPFYSLLLDKFADGDPSNNDFFNTTFEYDYNEVNFRYGGDIRGLERHLDYIQGMGMRAIYIAGTPFINMPWQADSECGLWRTILHSKFAYRFLSIGLLPS